MYIYIVLYALFRLFLSKTNTRKINLKEKPISLIQSEENDMELKLLLNHLFIHF